jgi:Leucine-rich repeat (LRR) protein
LRNLQVLELNGAQLRLDSGVWQLPNLSKACFEDCDFDPDGLGDDVDCIPCLQTCTSLQHLVLKNCSASPLPPTLTYLQVATLHHPAEMLHGLTNLRHLALDSEMGLAHVAYLSELKSLEHLSLPDEPLHKLPMQILERMPSLTSIEFDYDVFRFDAAEANSTFRPNLNAFTALRPLTVLFCPLPPDTLCLPSLTSLLILPTVECTLLPDQLTSCTALESLEGVWPCLVLLSVLGLAV